MGKQIIIVATTATVLFIVSVFVAYTYQGFNPLLSKTESQEPLGEELSVVISFLKLVSEHKATQAAQMMIDDQKLWVGYFDAFNKFSVNKLAPSDNHSFFVEVDVEMKPESANAIAPYYGYQNGVNTRWLKTVLIDKDWKITSFSPLLP